MKERNHVTRAMVQWCVAVHTTFRLGSRYRGVLWRARWSCTWTWTWSTSNVSQALNLNLLLPLRVWVWLRFFFFFFFSFFHGSSFLHFFSFFFSLRLVLKLVALLFAKAVIPTHMPRLGPNKGDLILFCNTKNREDGGRIGKARILHENDVKRTTKSKCLQPHTIRVGPPIFRGSLRTLLRQLDFLASLPNFSLLWLLKSFGGQHMRVVGRRWGYLDGCADWVGTRSLVCGLGVLPVQSGSGSGFGRHSFAK